MNLNNLGLIFVINFIVFIEKSSHEAIKIGFLSDSTEETKLAFRYALKRVQQDKSFQRRLIGDVKKIDYGDVFSAYQATCTMLENGVLGIIGPTSTESSSHVRSICDTKEIPLIELRTDEPARGAINLNPAPSDLGAVFLDLINAWEWQSFTVLYEDSPWLSVTDLLLKNCSGRIPVAVRQLDVTMNNNYRPRLLQVKQSEEKNIILCCSIDSLEEILKQAQQVGLLSDQHSILITSLDMHTIDLEPYQYSGTNITGVRMINPDDSLVQSITGFFAEKYLDRRLAQVDQEDDDDEDIEDAEIPLGLTPEGIRLETALIYDSVILFAHVMANNADLQSDGFDCQNPTSIFVNGTTITNYMRSIPSFKGLTGEINFNPNTGHRDNFHLEVLELVSDGLKKVGTWNSTQGLITYHGKLMQTQVETDPFKIKVLKVLTVDNNEPYGMRKLTSMTLNGNDQFEGFGIELIEKLAAKIGFNYTFEIQEDRKYGNRQSDGSWDGMIGELQADRADLAITDLTITSDRVEGADFTMPFMDLGIQILFQSPKKAEPELLSFMEPLSKSVWGCVACAILLVSVSFFILGRMSPKEWDNPFPCIQEPTVLQNQFTLKNSMWFTIGAILQEGSDIAPKATSTRIVASIWWFFTLIMVSSYTANLASFLTVQTSNPAIENVADMIAAGESGKLTYGAKKGGSTLKFFEIADSNEDHKKMYEFMMKYEDDVLMKENIDGVAKAKTQNYAFLMESTTIEYITQRNCDLMPVGDKLDQKGYGIAMKKGSPLRGKLDQAILQMQESGELTRMKTKWWNEKRGGGACDTLPQEGAPRLSFDHVKGIFLVLFSGCCFGTTLGILRWLFTIRKISKYLEVPFGEVFKDELKFTFEFSKNVKPSYLYRKESVEYDTTNDSPRESSESNSGSRSNSINRERQPRILRLSNRNINKIEHENI
ncbi:hypothetical protein PVAND_013523 [Polypedilum vanderplanki]|uniref:Uncharacterized protein n=1 Tax=Polypedilum vanderplanki TaxID=319348 RepID=A0A9J6CQY6_POLVA|nr:hypothetical protein PVAND_013523 [Polypedilum vanderplanki]